MKRSASEITGPKFARASANEKADAVRKLYAPFGYRPSTPKGCPRGPSASASWVPAQEPATAIPHNVMNCPTQVSPLRHPSSNPAQVTCKHGQCGASEGFIRLGPTDVTKSYEFIWFGDIRGPKSYKLGDMAKGAPGKTEESISRVLTPDNVRTSSRTRWHPVTRSSRAALEH